MKSFKAFTKTLITEALHPELMAVISSRSKGTNKSREISRVIEDLKKRNEKIGTNPNKFASGSSRRWLSHSSAKYHLILDGIKTRLATGIKTAIPAGGIDKGGKRELGAGQLQNKVENSNKEVNAKYRILTHVGKEKDLFGHSYDKFETNREHGIFPPLLNYDHENHEWAHVGHIHDIKYYDHVSGGTPKKSHQVKNTFENLTITKHFPEGISEREFRRGIEAHSIKNEEFDEDGNIKRYAKEHTYNHPLVKKFGHYLRNVKGTNPGDFAGPNLGVFVHPHTGEKHIIARDHGYDEETHKLYWG